MTNQLQNQHHRRAVDVRIPAIEKYAYCLCLHVKPTTIFIAVFRLTRALLFASILLNTEFNLNDQMGGESPFGFDERHRSTLTASAILLKIIEASVSAVGIYAVISGRAALLMPLYAILIVDFFIEIPRFYSREPDAYADSLVEFRSVSSSNNQYTRHSFMLFSTINMIVKIYFLCVIWKCYRYLRLIELVRPIRLSELYPHLSHNGGPQLSIVRVLGRTDSTDIGTGQSVAPPPYECIAASMKPPNYEEAMKSTASNMSLSSGVSPQHQQQPTVVIDNPTAAAEQLASQGSRLAAEPGARDYGSNAGQPTDVVVNTANPVTVTDNSELILNTNSAGTAASSFVVTTDQGPPEAAGGSQATTGSLSTNNVDSQTHSSQTCTTTSPSKVDH